MVIAADRLLRCADVCTVLAISRATLYKMIRKGDFPAGQQLGGNVVRWRQSVIDAWLSSLAD